MYSYGPLHMDEQRQANQLEPTYKQLCTDTGCSPKDQPEAMDDREVWRESPREIRDDGVTLLLLLSLFFDWNKCLPKMIKSALK